MAYSTDVKLRTIAYAEEGHTFAQTATGHLLKIKPRFFADALLQKPA